MKMSDEVKPQTFQAVKFLQRWSKLTAGKQGKVEIQALPAPTDWPAVFKLIGERDGKANLYFLVNSPKVVA